MRITEPIARQWELLRMIPREPRTVTPAELRDRLAAHGYEVDIRTVQRDLIALETKFMLRCRTEGRANHWYWSRRQSPLQIPAMTRSTAITLLLVRDYLLPILPSLVTDELGQYFDGAKRLLEGTKFARWRGRVRTLRRGPVLSAPAIDLAVREAVYAALLDDRQLEVVDLHLILTHPG